MSRSIMFDIPSHYELVAFIGEGAYGTVCSAIHKPTKTKVAIKKIQPFSKSLLVTRTLRELKLLKYFHKHENIVSVLDKVKPTKIENMQAVYIVQELMDSDLQKLIAQNNQNGVSFGDDHIQFFTYQMLRALKAIHSAEVIHRDLKPSNILINSNCDLKLCDFGLARCLASSYDTKANLIGYMTEYVATRWYRAPEIMLTFQQYTTSMDIWSCGCLLAEMVSGQPLFPGRDYHHQLWLILETLGSPSLEDYQSIKSDRAKKYIANLPFQTRKPWDTVLKRPIESLSPELLDLLDKLLTFNPDKRISAAEALEHPYLKTYHDPEDEPTYQPLNIEGDIFWMNDNKSKNPDGDLDEESALPMETLTHLLYEEVLSPLT